jgi:small subunit ribosomal protein S20
MPNLQQAKKALRQSDARRTVNDKRRRAMRESVKDIRSAIKTGSETIAEKLSKAFQALDKAAKRGVIKSGTASRRKSRLAKAAQKVAE